MTQQTYSALERNAETVGVARLLKLLSLLGVELVLSKPDADQPALAARTKPRKPNQPSG